MIGPRWLMLGIALALSCFSAWTGQLGAQVNPSSDATPSQPASDPKHSPLPPDAAHPRATAARTRSRQVVSLLPADQPKKSSGSGRKQTIDLRSGSSLPDESLTARSTNRAPVLFVGETERSHSQADNWVDLAIPEKYFEESQVSSPTDASPGSQPATQSSPPAKPERQTPSSPNPSGSVQSPSSVSTQPPSTTLDLQDNPAAVSSTGETPGSSQRVPGQTFEPDQAIPDWLWPDGDRNTVSTADDSASSTQPATPSSQPGRAAPAKPPIDQPLEAVPSILIDPPSTDRVSPEQPGTQSQHSVMGTQQTLTETQVPLAGPQTGATTAADPPNYTPVFSPIEHHPALIDAATSKVEYSPSDFSPENGPLGSTFDPNAAAAIYRGKFAVPVQRPWIELWRPLYTSGIYPPAPLWFGATNPMKPHFMVYGDFRSAVGFNRNQLGKSNVWGNVLNLDMDLQLTSTERIHAFVSPLNRAAQATGLAFNDQVDVVDGTNFNFNTLFFEGDVGALLGGATGKFPQFDLPFTFGLIPLVYQNGIWANDAVLGAAVALPARHSRALKWSNFDATLFWATDNITTDAFPNQDSAADLFGTAWFIDAYEGYIEADYAFVNDNTGAGLGYHNLSFGFTRRYLARLSNSIRYVVNLGQDELDKQDRTADGHLILLENSLITAYPNTVVPYLNLFYGQGRPQSLARAGVAGGILNNTGINFETDGITGYPTLDATAHNTWGLASGINLLGSQFAHQLILEMAMVMATGPQQLRNAEGDQYAVGMRYQKPLNHFLIFRTDHMLGFREGADDLHGSRFELRWKF